jgi:hypothetical protein
LQRRISLLADPVPHVGQSLSANRTPRNSLGALISLLAVAVISILPLETAHAQGTTLTVDASNVGTSTELSGYYVALYQGGSMVASGFEPIQFSVTPGQTYSIEAGSHGSCTFGNWFYYGAGGGAVDNSSNPMTFSATSSYPGDLTAEYGCVTSATPQLTITTEDTNGNPVSGFFTVLNQSSSNTIAGTGFTPYTFTLNGDTFYTVQVDNYQNCHFDHWLDTGSTNPSRTVQLVSNVQYTAVMNCGTASSSVSVNSVDQNGDAISSYYTVLDNSAGGIISTGFTPVTFTTSAGQTYSIQVDNYGSCTFNHWSNTGGTSAGTIFVSGSSPQTFTAVYDCT